MEVLEKIRQQLEEFDNKKKSLVDELRKEFPSMFAPLFEQSKLIESIGWTAYTPYFNDGDECKFRVNTSDLYVNGEYDGDIEFLDWKLRYYLKGDEEYKNILIENPKLSLEEYKIVEGFKSLLESIPKDFHKDLFGDHCKVTMYKNGTIEVEEYEHD